MTESVVVYAFKLIRFPMLILQLISYDYWILFYDKNLKILVNFDSLLGFLTC